MLFRNRVHLRTQASGTAPRSAGTARITEPNGNVSFGNRRITGYADDCREEAVVLDQLPTLQVRHGMTCDSVCKSHRRIDDYLLWSPTFGSFLCTSGPK